MKQNQKDYVSIIYDEKRKPKTNYPKQLIEYLCTQFSLQKNSKLLEPGSGRCDFLNEFQKAGFHCEGLDRDVSSINNEYGLQVKKCDITKEIFPYDDNSFDIIYHKSVIEHMYDPTHFMEESYRILKPKGKHIILTPDWRQHWKSFYDDFTHCRPYNMMALHDLLNIYNTSSNCERHIALISNFFNKINIYYSIFTGSFNIQKN